MKIWSIKYTPKRVKDVKVNLPEDLKERLINMKEGKIPHFIFSGPSGSGRTTFARLLAKKRLKYTDGFKVITGETSITSEEKKNVKKEGRVSKKRLGNYSGQISGFPAFLHARAMDFIVTKPVITPYKIMVIREFQHIDNQESFRRIMEKFEYCRMIFISSGPSSIIDPITSRCVYIPFKKIKIGDFLEEIKRVGNNEGIKIPLKVSKLLYSIYKGNLGASINALQLHFIEEGEITREIVKKKQINAVTSTIPLIQSAFDRSYALVMNKMNELLKVMSPMELYSEINSELVLQNLEDIDEILQYMAKEELKLLRGKNQRMQLINILMNM